jgi:phosphatidylglycerol lysyltransferase
MPSWLRLALRWLRAHGNRFYNFKGLDSFKSKFEPEDWEEIVALADAPSFPPRALWAITAAFTSESPVIFLMKSLFSAGSQELRWARRRP